MSPGIHRRHRVGPRREVTYSVRTLDTITTAALRSRIEAGIHLANDATTYDEEVLP